MKKEKKVEVLEQIEMEWKVNIPSLFKEIVEANATTSIMRIPLQILMAILSEVGERAAQINDPILNGLMCRLTVYEISDPYNKGYNKKVLSDTMEKYKQAKKELKDEQQQ